MSQITNVTFDFFNDLKQNNQREWFQDNKDRYENSKKEITAFADELINRVNEFDVIETASGAKSLYRIYRDIRFSKDKTPYKTHWAGHLKRAGESRRGGMYFGIGPDETLIGGGFWSPSKEDLLHIRKQIEADALPLRDVLGSKDFVNYFGVMDGDQLKSAPKGFDKEHPEIDLLRYKQYLVMKKFTNEEVLSSDFVGMIAEGFQKMLPFLDCFTEYLTTNLNGESVLN